MELIHIMNHPYRDLYVAPAGPKKKKRFCIFFHDWEINLKPDGFCAINNSCKEVKGRRIFYINVWKDYNLKCSSCGKERDITHDAADWVWPVLIIEHSKELFSNGEVRHYRNKEDE